MITGDRVKKVIIECFGCDPGELVDSAELSNDLGLDDIDLVYLAMGLEEEFGVRIKDEDIIELITIENVTDFVNILMEKENEK